jgi:hypothetical protein
MYGKYRILQHTVMTDIVNKFDTMPQLLGKEIFSTPEPEMSNNISIDIVHSARHLAQFRDPDAEAHISALQTVGQILASIPCMAEKKQIPGKVMAWLRQPGTEHKQWGERKVIDEIADLDKTIELRKEWMRWQLLETGAITVSEEHGPCFTLDFEIPDTHLIDLVGAACWNGASPDIIGDICNWKELIQQDSGHKATDVYLPSCLYAVIIADDTVQNMMQDAPALKAQINELGYFKRWQDLNWHPYDAGYVPLGGNFTRFLTAEHIVMIAKTAKFTQHHCPSTDPKANFKPGKFSKSWEVEDPAGIWVLEEENILPAIPEPEAIICADVISL